MTGQYHFFCDEAGITKDQFLVVSGIAVPTPDLPRIHRDVEALRATLSMSAELKWEKITNQKEKEYKEFIDYVFKLINSGQASFHSLIIPYRQFDHKLINGNDKNLSLQKMYYELILHRFCRYYGRGKAELFIYPDLSSRPFCGPGACRMLNHGLRKCYDIASNPVKSVDARDSADCNFLQLNDLILGAVCAHRNQRHMQIGGRAAKLRLAEYVLKKAKLKSYQEDTPINGPKRFTVWNLRSRLLKARRMG